MLSPNLLRKLELLAERHEEVGRMLNDPAVIANNSSFREHSQEYAQLDPIVTGLSEYQQCKLELADAESWRKDSEMRDLAEEEIPVLVAKIQALENHLALLLIPKDPRDEANLYLEIRAGTGGDEAAIFAGDLYRMYARFAEKNRWQFEILSANPGEHGGYREIIARVEGKGAYSKFKFESGTHRVQRVPDTETQGRIHTSAATVAILPEIDEIEDIDIPPNDIRTDTFRASGAGGQHVNKTDSAIRITHIPTGIVVECQDERSQHKNRARAMSLLKARILDEQRAKQNAVQAESRRLQVGSGDRSQRIRTYNFPQGRITDHRVEGLTLYKLPEIIAGDLDELADRLTVEHQADELKILTEGQA
jgi:peptide chain release factor 1